MNYYFNKVLEAIHQETCFARLSNYEQKLIAATNKLALYIQNRGKELENVYKDAFLDECMGS